MTQSVHGMEAVLVRRFEEGFEIVEDLLSRQVLQVKVASLTVVMVLQSLPGSGLA